MDTEEYNRLKDMKLSDIATEMEQTKLYPLKPLLYGELRDERYPEFPDALREVEAANPRERCVVCGKPGYYYPADEAFAPGHCYSDAGQREFRSISSTCEFCFDYLMREPEEEEQGEPDRDWKEYYEQSLIDEEYSKDRFSDLIEDREPDEHSDEL
ncbi:hypothetical protein SEA_ATRAXI_23 [Microbacterium phage Atraxi]|nr:hypothetical protein SEA_ATRAXI_23 [Microbacterium phage Atraxi]